MEKPLPSLDPSGGVLPARYLAALGLLFSLVLGSAAALVLACLYLVFWELAALF